jgi:hypothetical protein
MEGGREGGREGGKEGEWACAKYCTLQDLCTANFSTEEEEQEKERGQAQWCVPIIPATQEMGLGGSCFRVSPSEKLVRPHLNK